jgi:hypothetical protein
MNIEEWELKYKPMQNDINFGNASFNGTMFETYGDELMFVELMEDKYIWTLQDSDEGKLIITSGYLRINRLGYFVTEVPWEEYEEVELENN